MSSNTLSQDEAISQFCGVTGADDERAKGLLEACDWNLELAINMHVDTDDGRTNKPSTSNSSAGPSTADSPVVIAPDEEKSNSDLPIRFRQTARRGTGFRSTEPRRFDPFDQEDSVRPPIPPVRQVLVQQPAEMPQRRYNHRTGTSSTSGVYDAFRDFQAEAQWQEMVQEGESSATTSEPTQASNASSKTTLQELFRPPLELMFRGSFVSAREAGQTQNRWLLVNIQNGKEFPCQILNRDVWSNQTVKDILKENFIFWQVYHDSFEGVRYSQFYNVSSYPHVSIIDPRTGEQMKSWPTSIDHNSFCDSVLEFLTEHPCTSLTCLI